MKDVMIDIETMGVLSDAAIVSIGAVKFDRHGIYDEFYVDVDLESSVSSGGTISPSTVIWWMKQDAKARDKICSKNRKSIECALSDLSGFINGSGDVWACGSGFDNVIIRNAYNNAGLDCPFPFWRDKCFRTVRDMHPEIDFEMIGVKHNALDDAKSQALHLIKIFKKM